MLKVIRRIFSFNDWSVHHPGEPHPGDMLDAQFDEIVDRVDVWEERIRKIVTDDGKVAHGAINEHSLSTGLDQRLRDDIDLKIQPALDQLSVAMALANQLKAQSIRDAKEVRDASLVIGQSLAELKDRRDIAIEDVNAALAQAREMIAAAQGAQDGWSNAQKDAFAGEQTAQNWAVASMDWAEYMPGPLPSDIIAMMGITGDHWSSRWWANQASQIVADFNVDTAAVLDAAARAEAAAADAEAAEVNAEADATAAAISASNASTAAATATTAAGQATDSADQAADSATATDSLYDQFDDRYLGSKAAPPATDNDGNTLLNGALYWNDTVKRTEVWNGATWQAMGSGGGVSTEAADVHFAPVGTIASDNVQAAIQELDGEKVAKAGDTMTGNLTINKNSPILAVNNTFPPVEGDYSYCGFQFNNQGLQSWDFAAGDAMDPNFYLDRYDAAGAWLGSPFTVFKETGIVAMDAGATTLAPAAADNTTRVPTTAWVTTELTGKVAKAGDTMTGNLTISRTAPSLILDAIGTGSQAQPFSLRRDNLLRWFGYMQAGVASDFGIARANDAGAYIDTPFAILRATGIVGMPLGATTLAPAAADSSTRIPTTAWVAGELATGDALRVAKAGDTMTGTLNITPASGTATLNINATTSVGSAIIQLRKGAGAFGTYITTQVASTLRWALWLGDATAESGSDTGSDFVLNGYNDAGASPKTAFRITRATGIVQMPLGATTLTQTAGNNTTAVATTAFVKAAVDTGDALQVLKAGDTMTGVLTIKPSGATYAILNLDKGLGALGGGVKGMRNGVDRWILYLANATAESSGNVGSDVSLGRYNDAGTYMDAPLVIPRSTGVVSMPLGITSIRLGFTNADIGFGGRAAGSPAGTVGRTVWNTALDLSGTDVAVMDDTGRLVLGARTLPAAAVYRSALTVGKDATMSDITMASNGAVVFNGYYDQTNFKALETGFVGYLHYTQASGVWALYGSAASVAANAYATLASKMTIQANGEMWLPASVTVPADLGGYRLNVGGTAYIAVASGAVYIVSSTGGNFMHGNIATKDWSIFTDNSPRMQIIASTGYLVANVNAQKPGGGDWLATSDARIKTVLGDYGSGLDAILALRPVRYTYKGNDTAAVPDNNILNPDDPNADQDTTPATVPYRNSVHYTAAINDTEYVGLIAQEAETVLPSLVTLADGYIDGEPVTDMRNLDTTELTFTLINAVKQLATRIEALEAAPIATKGKTK